MRGVGELREKDVVPAVTQMTTGQGRSKRADIQGRRTAPRWLVQAQPAGAQRLARSAGWLKRCFLADRPYHVGNGLDDRGRLEQVDLVPGPRDHDMA